VAALAGGRRADSTAPRPAGLRRRRASVTPEQASSVTDAPEHAANAPERHGGSASAGDGRPGSRGTGDDDRPGQAREGEGGAFRASLKPGSAARSRRRRVEAELIGLPGGVGPDWWGPCWERGVDGGVAPARLFDELAAFHPEVRVLHGLGVAGTPSVIDHVLIGTGGVVVAGTETCAGRVRTDGVHLRVRGRDRSPLIDVALWRAEVVRQSLAQRGMRDVPVHGVVHWEHLEGLGDRAIALRGVPLLSAGAAIGMAATGIDLSPLAIERVVAALEPATHPA
jgi:hypothetical protein